MWTKNLQHFFFVSRLNDVKTMVSQLYEAMNVQEHQLSKEKELTTQLETIKQELLPLEEVIYYYNITALVT